MYYPTLKMPMFKADMSDSEMQKVRVAKAEMGAKSNVDCLLKFVDVHNELRKIKGRNIGRDII